jgi:hypothetical protein
VSTFFLTSIDCISIIQDISARININDFFFNNYYYFWTSFWYIPFNLLNIFVILYIYFGKHSLWIQLLFKLILVIIFGLRYVEYTNLNLLYAYELSNAELLNLMLTNSINRYHPIMLYISITILLLLGYQLFNSTIFIKYNFSVNNLYITSSPRSYFNILNIIITLYLGSWWALQEGSWGGWWNWDSSEVFGMLIMVTVLILIHARLNFNFTDRYLIIILTIILFMLYLFTQLNFSLISHNFSLKNLSSIHSLQIYTLLFIFNIKLLFFFLRKFVNFFLYYKIFFFKKISTKIKIQWLLNIIVISAISILVMLSYYSLVNNFLWKTFKIVTISIFFDKSIITALTVTFVIINYSRITILNYLILSIMVFYNIDITYTILTLVLINLSFITIQHYIVILFLICALNISSKDFLVSYIITNNTFVTLTNTLYSVLPINFIIHGDWIERSFTKFQNLFPMHTGFSILRQNTSFELDEILMTSSNTSTSLLALNGIFNKIFYTLILDFNTFLIKTCLFSILLTVYFFVKKPKVIIF